MAKAPPKKPPPKKAPARSPRLKKYAEKRRFDRTPEPEGGDAPPDEPIFVIQKHAAQRLHYDLRLQVGDTLRSWAVPEGPSLDTKVRRFAKQTEDHPMDYATFEGRIPEGEYGGGSVIVWDRGTWTSLKDPDTALAEGELKFRLTGEKLRGGWTLVRLPDDLTNWLLIKERDPAAKPTAEFDVVIAEPNSVITGASVEAVAPLAAAKQNLPKPRADKIKGAIAAKMPKTWKPQLAEEQAEPPSGAEWVHEIKYDGYRTLCLFENGKVKLLTRNGHDWTHRYGAPAKALATLPCKSAIIDGEIVVQDPRGVTRISLLEQALAEGQAHAFTFFAFDLCYLDGYDLSAAALTDRKQALERLIDPLVHASAAVQYSQHVVGGGMGLFARASEMGLEGIISKKASSRYVQGRSPSWMKIKRSETDEFVVVGFSSNTPKAVSSLILAEEKNGELLYAGKAGSGIGEERAREFYKLLAPHRQKEPPLTIPDDVGTKWSKDPLAGAQWVAPAVTAKIGHRGRTDSGSVRQAVVLSLAPRKAQKRVRAVMPKLVTDRDLAGIRLTNPTREMFKGSGVTKLDIALHYARVGDWMLPDLMRRPVTLVRCPTGEKKDCFYQRHAFEGLPDGVERVDLSDEEGRAAFISIVEPKGYLALAQFGALEFHAWGCHIDDPEHVDRLVLDLDPAPEVPWSQVCDGAEILKAKLEKLGFAPFLRTTGGKGLHIVMALGKGQDWSAVKTFAHAFARRAEKDAPNFFTSVSAKSRRTGRIFIDYLRNGRGATAIASYSLRARDGFPVATPIRWDELRSLNGGDAFTIATIQNRLTHLASDPWSELCSHPTKITAKMARDVGVV